MISQDEALQALLAKGWVSLRQAAPIIGVAYGTIRSMRERGQLDVHQVGGVGRVYPEALYNAIPPKDPMRQRLRSLGLIHEEGVDTLSSTASVATEPKPAVDPFEPEEQPQGGIDDDEW